MTGRDAAGALFFVAAAFFLALALWPYRIMNPFEFLAPNVHRLQTSGRARQAWRIFYGLAAALFLAVGLVVWFIGRSS